jgi:hypothetical protein
MHQAKHTACVSEAHLHTGRHAPVQRAEGVGTVRLHDPSRVSVRPSVQPSDWKLTPYLPPHQRGLPRVGLHQLALRARLHQLPRRVRG